MITRVLGYWQPSIDLDDYSNFGREAVGNEFKSRLEHLGGYKITIQSIHSPLELIQWYRNTTGWHKDENDINKEFIVWSNVQPTDILFKDNSMLASKNGAIILISNLEVVHRTPTPLNPKRWLVRTDYLL